MFIVLFITALLIISIPLYMNGSPYLLKWKQKLLAGLTILFIYTGIMGVVCAMI